MSLTLTILLLATDAMQFAPFMRLAPAAETSYLIKQDFEGAGYDNGETWTETGTATMDEDYTGVVLAGAQSYRLVTAADGGRTQVAFAGQTELWTYLLIRPISLSGADQVILWYRNNIDNGFCNVSILIDGTIRIGASGTATSVGAVSEGVTYHCWFHYKKGTGANAVVDFAFSTDGVRPTSGNNFVQLTGQTTVQDAHRLDVGYHAGVDTSEYVFDKVRVDDAQIGDNPP